MKKTKSGFTGRPVQEPVTREETGPIGGTVSEHPAFAQISAVRGTGGNYSLYGSDFTHNNTMTLKIAASTLRRDLSSDWFSQDSTSMIEVIMSEAQWATFVASPNMGSGTPCTLSYKDGEMIPALPKPIPRTEQFSKEARERMTGAVEAIDALTKLIEGSGLSKQKQADILRKASEARSEITSNQAFVAQSFDEHMEETVEKAKIEVGAYLTSAVQRAGLEHLSGGKPVIEMVSSTTKAINDKPDTPPAA